MSEFRSLGWGGGKRGKVKREKKNALKADLERFLNKQRENSSCHHPYVNKLTQQRRS